jgi:hypothetical protein
MASAAAISTIQSLNHGERFKGEAAGQFLSPHGPAKGGSLSSPQRREIAGPAMGTGQDRIFDPD